MRHQPRRRDPLRRPADPRPCPDRAVHARGSIVYRSALMEDVVQRLERFAPARLPVLVTGETGTGKDLAARLLHDSSGREGRFAAVNVTALPDSLFEREFFGHERGAFTGAVETRRGLVESCDGGTLFLDEIGSLSLDRQATLLRVIEEGRVRRIGGDQDRAVDVRFVLATNERLEHLRDAGRFRNDLWYRIARLHVHVPALRERGTDVIHIAQAILAAGPDRPRRLDASASASILEYRWPGNVRELQGVLAAARLLDDDGVIDREDLAAAGFLPAMTTPRDDDRPLVRRLALHELLPLDHIEGRVLRDLRSQAIEAALILTGGRKLQAATLLGVSRQTLYGYMSDLGYRPADDEA